MPSPTKAMVAAIVIASVMAMASHAAKANEAYRLQFITSK